METRLSEKTVRGLGTAWLDAGPVDGDAPLVVMLHGFPDAPESWSFQMEPLKDRYRVLAPYARGAGPSEKALDVRRYGPDSVALDTLAILDEVDPERRRKVFLVGHDLGSVHAWHLAGLLQERAAGLVVINGLTIPQMLRRMTDPRQVLKSWYIWLMMLPVVPEVLFKRFADRLLRFAHKRGGLSPANRPDPSQLRDALVGPLNQYRAFLRAAPEALRAPKRRISCPVLVIFGAQDAFLEPPTHAELSRDASRLTVRILPGNHWLHREQPEKVNRLLQDFFAQNGGRT